MRRLLANLLLVVTCAAIYAGAARAAALFDQTSMVGLPSVAAPAEYSFTESPAQALVLTLTDLQAPAAFSALQVAVTLGDALIVSGTLDATTHTAVVNIPAAAGTYTVDVIGTPDATQGFGSFGVCVAPAASPTSCIASDSYSGNLVTPSTPSSNLSSALNTNFTTTATSGTYTVTITDDAFPVALQMNSISGGIALGSQPITTLAAGTTQVTLAAGTTYQLIVGAIADPNAKAGLYGIHIADPTGVAVFDRTVPVAGLAASIIVDNPSTQALNLTLTDEGYPSALARLGVAVTQGGSPPLARLTAAGTVPGGFMAPAGSVEVWQYAIAGAQPGIYDLDLSPVTGTALLKSTQVVNTTAGASPSYAFVIYLPSAGTYKLTVNDFEFPSTLQGISATVAQNGSVLPPLSNGTFTSTQGASFAAAQGSVVVLVDVTPPAGGSGIFGVTVQTTAASPQIVPEGEFTQAVGAVFSSQTINLGTTGNYQATLADLGFPANFQDLAAIVSNGSQVLGKIYGGGHFTFTAAPGSYLLTYITTPGSQNYGLYSLNISSAPASATLMASAKSVTIGSPVTLTWTSQNATSCTAGGAADWTGPRAATSGSLAVSVTATTTYTLTCTGAGGTSAPASVTVTATPAAGSGGGGGALDLTSILALLSLCAASSRYRLRTRGRR